MRDDWQYVPSKIALTAEPCVWNYHPGTDSYMCTWCRRIVRGA